MSQIEAARKVLGQLFIIGFNGLELAEDTSAFLSQANIGGVILYAPNYESPGQVAELINQVQECRTSGPLWISVDHEGGRVQRFKKGFTKLPDAATIGKSNSPRLAYEVSEMIAGELRAVGVNVNFFPVADIATHAKNSGIGNRSYGDNEELVTKISTALVRGHITGGVQPCIKHFPGHGDTPTDPNVALPKIDLPLETLRDRELRPFVRAFKSHCSMVMTAHVLYPQLDPDRPATLSPYVLRELLRKEMRYTKVIVSDDMEMKAITDKFDTEKTPCMALEAGCDVLLYKTEAAGRHAYTTVLKALDVGKISPGLILEAHGRVSALKKEVLASYHAVPVGELGSKIGTPENQAMVDKLLAPQ